MRRVLLQPKARRMPGVSRKLLIILDSRLRGNDKIVGFMWLCKGVTEAGRPLHIQCSYPTRPLIKIITTYEPDKDLWIDYKIRRE